MDYFTLGNPLTLLRLIRADRWHIRDYLLTSVELDETKRTRKSHVTKQESETRGPGILNLGPLR